ncbi:hypothetical protein BD410DRAFT_645099 [Rickenella mellea]|uniref:DUF6534 domain-containing protein n=1 Tax=Rickenella mellea TaxID=50990 RepID=A0A4Y7PLT5_9AGAM|nr:hypothetical protein BD410DRAFT_645099 [Rickenella mellea]
MSGPTLGNTTGALFICLILSTFLLGMICLQTHNYYQKFPEDRAHVKCFVAFVLGLNAVNVALFSEGMYHYLIANFGNFEALAEPYTSLNVYSLLNSFITWMCQLYFAWRVWRLSSGNYFLTVAIICLTCMHLAFATREVAIGFKAQRFHLNLPNSEFLIGMTLGSTLACDVVITGSLCFFLNKGRTGFTRTDSLIKSLILYSLCTGLVTSMFAIVNIVAFFSMQSNLIHLGIYFLMGKLYTASLLATLNSRDIFRDQWSRTDQNVNLSHSSGRARPGIVASQDRKGRDPIAIYMTQTSEVRTDDFALNAMKRDSVQAVDNSTKV